MPGEVLGKKKRNPSGKSDCVGAYPLFAREFELQKHIAHKPPESDFWVIVLQYIDTPAGYRAGPEIDPRQRVAFVAELWDKGSGQSPQQFVQELPLEFGMLSSCVVESPIPISITH